MRTALIWAPQKGPQHCLIDCPVPEVLFGGARGGGKTDAVLGKLAIETLRYGRLNAVIFRRELPQADDLVERGCEIFLPLGAEWRAQAREWRFATGARIRVRPLERIEDAAKYQGQNLNRVVIEEAGNYPDSAPIDRLWGALRSADGVPSQMVLTANPGGPGQNWIRDRYIAPHPGGMKIIRERLPNGSEHRRVYIPSRVQDNAALLNSDPGYVDRLYLVGSQSLVRAWLDGDWSAVEGAFFDAWSDRNVCDPFELPADWLRFRSFDWGSMRPFSVGWWAVAGDALPERGIPRGALVRYREWYGSTGKPNEGLKLTVEQVAAGILERETKTERFAYSAADPAIFSQDGGPSMAERMSAAGVDFIRADNARVGRAGAMGGWDQMRARIRGDEDGPQLVVFKTCRDFIRTVPVLQHDPDRPEDLDTKAEDHAADEARYACMSRPWIPMITKPEPRRRYGGKQGGASAWAM